MIPNVQPALNLVDSNAIWSDFSRDVAGCSARLTAELRATADAVRALVNGQLEQFGDVAAHGPSGRSIEAVALLYEEYAPTLLLGLVDAYLRLRPQQRALGACDDYDRALEQMAFLMPDTLVASGREWVGIIGAAHLSPVSRARLRMSRRLEVDARTSLLLGIRAHRARRRAIEGRLLVALAEMSLELLAPWRTLRRSWYAPVTGVPPGGSVGDELTRIRARMDRYDRDAARALADMEAWLARAPGRFARYFTTHGSGVDARLGRLTATDDRRREFLGRQGRTVDADLELDAQLGHAERELIAAVQRTRAAIDAEHQALVDELTRVMTWLDRWRPGDDTTFPPAAAAIVPAATRIRAFKQAVDGIALALPESVEVSAHLAVRPGVRRLWTVQAPRAILQDAIEDVALPEIGDGLSVLERQHQGVVLEIERAREVVAFARETSRAGASFEPRIEQEGIENARGLLQFHRHQIARIPSDVEALFAVGLLRALDRAHRTFDEGQFGLMRQAARDGLPRAGRALWRRLTTHGAAGAGMLARGLGRAYRSLLVAVGWMPAPPEPGEHVVARGYLTRTLGAEARLEQLPMVYQRLFRLVPVEDPRFLVGRQEELAAIADARALWEQGRDAAVLLVGARGSGKTSLINCAVQRELAGLEIVRADFVERLTTRDGLYGFLAQLLGCRPEELDRELGARRRVIVLEELERTFLRKAHGYEAVRTLLGLISRTSRQNLWLVSVNYFSFRLLNASLRMEPHFSHRINAMAVELAHLRDAILMRHNLSGLRLRFAPPLDRASLARRALRATGVPDDPEAQFFEALHRESGGVFRTAFALWQRYVDRAEGGVLYLKQPARPQHQSVVGSLNRLDLFTLAALLQHGSLTPREHSIVFQIDETRSRSWLDNLLARELIEPDPGRYGYRVVPDAAQIVRETLFRRNLG